MSWHGHRTMPPNTAGLTAENLRGRSMVLDQPERMVKVAAWMDGLASAGEGSEQVARFNLYRAPFNARTLVGSTEDIVIPRGMPLTLIEVPFLREYQGKLLEPGEYLIGIQAAPDPEISGAGCGRIRTEPARTNLAENPKGGALQTTGWTSSGLTLLEAVTLDGGTHPLPLVLPDGTRITTAIHMIGDTNADRGYTPFTAANGSTYWVSAYVYLKSMAGTGVDFAVRDAAAVVKLGGPDVTTLNQWQRLDGDVAADSAGTWTFEGRSLGAGVNDFYLTAALIETSSGELGAYFDGDMAPEYMWAAEAHNSRSAAGFAASDTFADGPRPDLPALSVTQRYGVVFVGDADWQPSSIVVPDLHYARMPVPEARKVFAGSVEPRSQRFASCEWYGRFLDADAGANAIARSDGPLADLVGERLCVSNPATGRETEVYCHTEKAEVKTDLALSKRAFMDIELLSVGAVDVLVEVLE